MFQHLDDGAQRFKPLYSEPVTTKPYLVPSLSNCPNHTWVMPGRNRKACFAILNITFGGKEQGSGVLARVGSCVFRGSIRALEKMKKR
jgi:hypothetical protein